MTQATPSPGGPATPAARFDPSTPNVARMYDYFLGGKDNFAADRAAAEQALKLMPDMREGARGVRDFLIRTVRYLAGEAGIRQYIDIGCGLPTQGNVHEIAQSIAPDSRVLYVDNDPVVIAHARALLESNPLTAVVRADMREPDQILESAALGQLIDLSEPVAVLLVSVLHIIAEDDVAQKVVARFRESIAPGSYLAISHAVSDLNPEMTAKLATFYRERTDAGGTPRANLRTRAEVEPYFDGLELIEPGLVYVEQWRPDRDLAADSPSVWAVGGIGRKN